MLNTIKQNKKAVLAFLLALVMLIGIIPFTATEAHAMTVDATGDVVWEAGDSFTLHLVSKDNIDATETHTVTYDGEKWNTPQSTILPAYAFAYIGEVKDIAYSGGEWSYTPVLQLDQSDAEKLTNADVMIATGEASKEDPLDLHFEHYYAKVTYNVILASEFNLATDTISRFDAVTCDGDYVNPYVDGNSYTAVIPANPYFKAGVHFALVTINGKKLEVEIPDEYANPNGSFVAGTHYTFDLKVGKDAVTIEQVSVNGNDPAIPFGDGWRGDSEEDLGADSITDTQDEGKTAWDNGDQIIATLTSQYYGEQTATLTHDGANWNHPEDMTFKYLENETPTVKAVYAPSNILGTGEYIEFDCELNGAELTVKLESATRNYSRLRIVGLPNQTLTVTTTKFTPAGATSEATDPYTLTTDENGNAFLYGTFAEGATISVKQGDVVLKEYAFTANKHPGGTEHGKSYMLDAVPVIDGTLGGKTTATEDDINALVEQLKVYVDNGITTIIVPGTEHAMYESALGTIPAYAEALYLLTDLDRDSPYCGTIDLILPDATEIIDFSFDSVDALKSITLPKVTIVGDGAFYGCQYLKQLTFGSVITEVVEIKSGVFASLGIKSDNEACDLVLNCGQLNAEDKYKPNLESNVWYIGEWSGETEWKSITLTHTGECDECKAQ